MADIKSPEERSKNMAKIRKANKIQKQLIAAKAA